MYQVCEGAISFWTVMFSLLEAALFTQCLSGTHYHDNFPSLEVDPYFIPVWSGPTGSLEHRKNSIHGKEF